MGALHRGHAALMDRARKVAGASGTVAVSVFVNPSQFGPTEDLASYPRPFAADKTLCEEHGVDLLFHPPPEEMYPPGYSTWVTEEAVSGPLCGRVRPGHFRGVCTVVLKLFGITGATHAVFGLKDFQQCAVLRRMIRDLNLCVELDLLDTVREADGLALSSRNSYLSPAERAEAPILRQALLLARTAYRAGETRASALRRTIVRHLSSSPAMRIDYVELADAETLTPVREVCRGTVIALAVFLGRTRLIDNLWLR